MVHYEKENETEYDSDEDQESEEDVEIDGPSNEIDESEEDGSAQVDDEEVDVWKVIADEAAEEDGDVVESYKRNVKFCRSLNTTRQPNKS